MVELIVLGALAFAAIVVFGVLASVFGLVMWLIALPFKVMGWLLQGIGLVLALPFIAIFGVIAAVVLGAGMLVFMLPFLPVALIVLGAWWLVRRNQRSAASVAR